MVPLCEGSILAPPCFHSNLGQPDKFQQLKYCCDFTTHKLDLEFQTSFSKIYFKQLYTDNTGRRSGCKCLKGATEHDRTHSIFKVWFSFAVMFFFVSSALATVSSPQCGQIYLFSFELFKELNLQPADHSHRNDQKRHKTPICGRDCEIAISQHLVPIPGSAPPVVPLLFCTLSSPGCFTTSVLHLCCHYLNSSRFIWHPH